MRFLYYTIEHMMDRHGDALPDLLKFYGYFRLFGGLVAPTDRTGILKFPVRMKSIFPLPKMRVFTKTYEEICNERAQELLLRAERLDTELLVFWSGGIDSTCLLVSLLKQALPAQLERMVVCFSEGAILEYPEFYRKHLRGRLRLASSVMFPYMLGVKKVVVNGECNDQLFGSDMVLRLMTFQGPQTAHERYSREVCAKCFAGKLSGFSMVRTASASVAEASRMTDSNEALALFYTKLFERVVEAAPIPLKSNFDFFWWINFALKWQTVYMRVLSFVAEKNASLITSEYAKTYHAPFFDTEDFQLWALNNIDKRMRDTWATYKWPAKDIIYDYTKDDYYHATKEKNGSLQYIVPKQIPFSFIDENFVFHKDLPLESFYDPDNDFI